MVVDIYYKELDLGWGGLDPVYVGSAATLVLARARARTDAEVMGRSLFRYTWRRTGDLFPAPVRWVS